MKKLTWVVVILIAISMIFNVVGCANDTIPPHTHKYAKEWTKDTTNHWYECTCGKVSEKAPHSFSNWEVTKEATEEAGSKERSCTVCGYTETGIICTADNVAEIITSLKASENPYTIIVTGEISSDTISAISTALKGNTSVKVNLDLGNTTGLTSIGDYAFDGCSNLSSVVIPDGVTSIGEGAFYLCSSLSSVVIPDGVTSIGDYAFDGCSNLSSVVIPDGFTSIGYGAFRDCSSLSSVVIPEGVTSIGNSAFSGCSSLENFDVDKNNLNYASSEDGKMLLNKDKTLLLAFPTASGDVTIPEGVTSIGNFAFSGCSNLSSVVIPEGVTSIGNFAFYLCSSLSSVVIPEGVTSIGNYAFSGCSNLSSVVIPESVTSIGIYAFDGCSNLSSVVIPDGFTIIEFGAFRDCSSLSSVVIPERVTRIGDYAFDGCSNLSSVVIPDGVTSIGDSAFSGCSSLSSVVIPERVTRIGDYAFDDCSSLTNVTFVDTDTWYYTSNYDYTNGTQIDVTVPSDNATYLRNTYRAKYWYKK